MPVKVIKRVLFIHNTNSQKMFLRDISEVAEPGMA